MGKKGLVNFHVVVPFILFCFILLGFVLILTLLIHKRNGYPCVRTSCDYQQKYTQFKILNKDENVHRFAPLERDFKNWFWVAKESTWNKLSLNFWALYRYLRSALFWTVVILLYTKPVFTTLKI